MPEGKTVPKAACKNPEGSSLFVKDHIVNKFLEHIEREKLNALFPEPLGISIPRAEELVGALIFWLKRKPWTGIHVTARTR